MLTTVAEKPRMVADDPALLLERFRTGDEEAFAEIVGRHRQAVYLVARRLLGTHEDADEAAQVAFVKAWRSRKSFRGDAAIRTWLTRIVMNVAKSMRTTRNPMDELDERTEQLHDPDEGAENRLRRERAGRNVRRAVEALPDRQREVVMLKVFSEMTYREVAQVLGLSEGSINAHLHQAVSNLRRLMVPGER